MTAKEAFIAVAEEFDNPFENNSFEYANGFHCSRSGAWSICDAIEMLLEDGKIDDSTFEEMLGLMKRNKPPGTGEIYWWGHSREDCRTRADFCRRMAELCEEKQ